MPKKDKQKPKRFDSRLLLKVLVIVCLAIAVLMFLRAYFLQHPPGGAPLAGQDITALGQNPLTNINDVDTSLSGKQANVWGDGVSDVLSLPATTGMWLKFTSDSNMYLGELSGGELKVSYTLPLNAAGIHFYANQSILFFTPGTNTSEAELVGIENGKTTKLLRLDSGWEFNSVYFDPVNKQFYLDVYNHNGASKLQVLRQGGSLQDIADTSSLSSPVILNLDAAQHQIFLQSSNAAGVNCVSLDLLSKTSFNKSCAGIAATSHKYAVTTDPVPKPLHLDFAGSILLTDITNGNQQYLKRGDAGDVFTLGAANNDTVAAEYLKIVQENSAMTLQPMAIQLYNISSHDLVREVKVVPDDLAVLLITNDNSLYGLAAAEGGNHILLREPVTPDVTWKPISVAVCSEGCTFTAL